MKNYFPEKVRGHKLETLGKKPLADLAKLCFTAACEGIVLVRNENEALPIKKGSRVSVFGRLQEEYYDMGTGSGGGVHPLYKTKILSSLRERSDITINEDLAKIYADWSAENPFEQGAWFKPFSQKEMPIDASTVKEARKNSDFALILLGRIAGEGKDSVAEPGSYFLSETEEDMIKKVCAEFDKVCVFLNIGSIMDMSWVEKYKPASVVCGWQCGQEGGAASVAVLMGDACPSDKLNDTVALAIDDYPSTKNFGDENKNVYAEDIYVGYRYFETFAPDKVQYPFGFGLSYTTFDIAYQSVAHTDKAMEFSFAVTNTGKVTGKETVQV
ncbi:MAG: glycoside hydrolase family 3 C-terminal domain-containing protein, partial [Clostridia bacterium]|nr:glycoside hydrolase family 3 C-terminal domain-containing protein [Clostridia bacterium]